MMNRKIVAMLALVVGLVAAPLGVAANAARAAHPTYSIAHAKRCRSGYVKRTERHAVRVRVKVHGKWKVERRDRRYVACVYIQPRRTVRYVAPVPTTTTTTVPVATPTTTTTTVPVAAPTTTTTVPLPTLFRTPQFTVQIVTDPWNSQEYDVTLTLDTSFLPAPESYYQSLGTLSYDDFISIAQNVGSYSVNVSWTGGPYQSFTVEACSCAGAFGQSMYWDYSGATYTTFSGQTVVLGSVLVSSTLP